MIVYIVHRIFPSVNDFMLFFKKKNENTSVLFDFL